MHGHRYRSMILCCCIGGSSAHQHPHPLRLPTRRQGGPVLASPVSLCEEKEDAGDDVSAPGAEQRLPAAPVAVPGVPGHMGGLWLLLGIHHMEEPSLPGTTAEATQRISISRVLLCFVCGLPIAGSFEISEISVLTNNGGT